MYLYFLSAIIHGLLMKSPASGLQLPFHLITLTSLPALPNYLISLPHWDGGWNQTGTRNSCHLLRGVIKIS